jgi:carbamoyltransferase
MCWNTKVKRREPFRPLAPSVLEEKAAEWFEGGAPDPFMTQVYLVRPERRALIPAITHVDGSSRPQIVTHRANPLYHRLITEFAALTGVPMLLNTSFNQDEPIVDTPEQAVRCFVRNELDALVIGRNVVRRLRGRVSDINAVLGPAP